MKNNSTIKTLFLENPRFKKKICTIALVRTLLIDLMLSWIKKKKERHLQHSVKICCFFINNVQFVKYLICVFLKFLEYKFTSDANIQMDLIFN